MHSVGLDEAHEMCMNKESKTSITRTTKDNMERLVHFFPYRSKAIKNLKDQLKIKTSFTSKVCYNTHLTVTTYKHTYSTIKLSQLSTEEVQKVK